MMKELLFVCYGLGIGGIEKCLVNLINALPEDKFNIDLLLMNPEYDLQSQIKRKINFIDRYKYVMNTTDTMNDISAHGGILKNIGTFIRYCCFRVSVKLDLKPWKWFIQLPKKYDVAIAYSHHDYSKYYVIEKTTANKKYLFYHDGVYKLNNTQKKRDHVYYPLFTGIVAVSRCTRDMLLSIYPEIHNKVIVLYNIINDSEIKEKANECIPSNEAHVFNIVTVGRMVNQKQPDVAVEIAKMLKEKGYKFKWQWIGDGPLYQRIKEMVEEYELKDYFIMRGNQLNPYPYMRHANLYVQPSRDEAYCTTTNEARILNKVIVATDCSGMDEQIINGVTGIITCNSIDEICQAIEYFINHLDKLQEFEDNVQKSLPRFSDYVNDYYGLFQ